jgi:hypothetical protein
MIPELQQLIQLKEDLNQLIIFKAKHPNPYEDEVLLNVWNTTIHDLLTFMLKLANTEEERNENELSSSQGSHVNHRQRISRFTGNNGNHRG